ncbi:hypothetical protein VWV83_004042, partial [Cronobacter sakazakii]|nr:hypothetical protein [Cronobacter sakazakii]
MDEMKVKSSLTEQEDNQQKVSVRLFKITDIPEVMEKMGWVVAAKFMRKWFNDPLYEMTMEEKIGDSAIKTIDKIHILSDLDFQWLLKSERVAKIFNQNLLSVTFVREYHNFLGKKTIGLKTLSNGLNVIISRIEQNGYFDRINYKFYECNIDFTSLPAMDLDFKGQFNFVRIGSTLWEKGTDELDDVYGALGSFIIKVAFTKLRVEKAEFGQFVIVIDELGWYVRDTYDFINDESDQLLGYWGWAGVKRPNLIDWFKEPLSIESGGERYYQVTNNSFLEYRNKIGRNKKPPEAGDFYVYSTIKRTPVSIKIHLDDKNIR